MDIAEPAILFIQVLIDRLAILIDRDGLAAKGISLFEIILAAESICSTTGYLYFLVNEIDPAFHKGYLLFSWQIM